MPEHTGETVDCHVVYYAQFKDWSGEWNSAAGAHGTSAKAVAHARELLAEYGYSGVGVRVIKVHTCQTIEVLDEREPSFRSAEAGACPQGHDRSGWCSVCNQHGSHHTGKHDEFRCCFRSLGMFKVGQRVMGEPGKYGKVVGHTDDGLKVRVWWDIGSETVTSPTYLSIVAKGKI